MDKTLGRIFRETIKRDLKQNIKDRPNFFIAHYKGLKASEVSQLRKELTKINVQMSVVRNRLARSLLGDLKLKDIAGSIDGPTAFVFSSDDSIVVSKSLVNFSKEHEHLKVELACIDEKILDKAAIQEFSSLPTREVLLARVVGGIKAPLSGLHNVLTGTLRKLVLVFDAIAKNRKEQTPTKEEIKEQPEETPKQEEVKDAQEDKTDESKEEKKPEEENK